MSAGAIFSPDRAHRYSLWRFLDEGDGDIAFIGLNPSTADETVDDPTIRRCIGFARRERRRRLWMLNLFAFRATDPKVMKRADDPVGANNDKALLAVAGTPGALVVACWGAHGDHQDRGRQVLALLLDAGITVHTLGWTKGGHPKHPLYLSKTTPLEAWPT